MYSYFRAVRAHRKIVESSLLDQIMKLLSESYRSMGNRPQKGSTVKNTALIL